MPVYPGLPEPTFGAILSHAESRSQYEGEAEFYLSKAALPGNLGTYIDAPFHRFAHLEDLSRISLDAVAGLPALVVDASPPPRAVTLSSAGEMFGSRAVLIRTGWDARWGTKDYWEPGPYLADELIDRIVRGGVRLVGVDFWNIDDPADNSRPAHTRLLREGILVVENLCNLGSLPRRGFRFFAVPRWLSAALHSPCASSPSSQGRSGEGTCHPDGRRIGNLAAMRVDGSCAKRMIARRV